ncbi:MAG: C1 family peptidase [bacterium]|nr:C1 family peptidase [bacterium]
MKKLLILCVFLPVLISNIEGSQTDLSKIRGAIKKAGAKWVADETSVSRLSPEERKNLLGWDKNRELLFIEEIGRDPPPEPKTYPPYLDWRDYNGKNYMTTVKSQGACGSCWAFAAVASMEALVNIQTDIENPDMDISEQKLVSCDYYDNGCGGGSAYGACTYLTQHGAPEEACFPYQASDAVPCGDTCDNALFTNRKLSGWGYTYSSVTGIKEHVQNGPIWAAMIVYEDFYNYAGGVYEHVSGSLEGTHAISIIGWDDSLSCWICKNSWGSYWGEHGYFRIRWGQCGIEQYGVWLRVAPIHYPKIEFSSIAEVNDSQYGDGDGVLNPGEKAELFLTLKAHPQWTNASSVYAILRSSNPEVIEVLDSTATYGTILSGELCTNETDSFVVLAAPDSTPTRIDMFLYVTAQGDQGGNYWTDPELSFEGRVDWSQCGWPISCGNVRTSPCVIDIYGDYKKEVIFGSDLGNLFVKSNDGEDVANFPVTLSNRCWSSPAVGDVDSDGKKEIVTASTDGNIYLFKDTGELIWMLPTGETITATPALFDFDSDGTLEIVIGSGRKLYVLHSDGSTYNSNFPFNSPDGTTIPSGVAIGDIDGDGNKDIVFGTFGGNLYALSLNGVLLTGWPFHIGGRIRESPSIANLDGTGLKVVVGSSTDTLAIVNPDGSEYLIITAMGGIITSPSFVDLDGDNELEIFFGANDSCIYAYHHTGVPVTGWPIKCNSSVQASIAFSDIDADGAPEIITVSKDGTVYVLNSNGSPLSPFPYQLTNSPTSPAVFDIDLDGDIEILFGSSFGMEVIDVRGSYLPDAYWCMYRGNPYRTGNYEDIYIGVSEEISPVLTSKVQIFPTPFMRGITILCKEPVLVDIYNLAGQKVRELISPKGKMVFSWDGTNEFGKPLPSGIYFCVVKLATGKTLTKKVIKLK